MNSVTLNTLEAKIVNYLLGIHTKMDVISFIASDMENIDPDKGITQYEVIKGVEPPVNWQAYLLADQLNIITGIINGFTIFDPKEFRVVMKDTSPQQYLTVLNGKLKVMEESVEYKQTFTNDELGLIPDEYKNFLEPYDFSKKV